MSLVESWRKIAQLNLSATSPLDNNNARGFGIALASAAENLEVACTPRAPRSEWFGTGPNQWDSWMVQRGTEWRAMYETSIRMDESTAQQLLEHGDSEYVWFSDVISCVPVSREGFPAPVGWHVVGG